ncbi:head maturation protease, ClpP-related [Mesonia sp. HuA40]|uniref:head maturation protease, ClpP-related n=1 Tax=Mesonia sp. HuA40 TaxID=2602761 RepID=UPI00164FFC69|nr:head maturation protease, ClpP-related [Mesonia sp. HuA40]
MAKKPYFSIVKNETKREATIYIYGAIGGFDWNTYEEINTASSFTQEFNEVEKEADTIHIRINSPGGYVFEGNAIYNTLIASKKKIITYNDGLAASMAALILLAGDEINAFESSLLMIHNSSSYYFGNTKEVEAQLQAGIKIDKALGKTISKRLDITEEEVEKSYLNFKDNWYTSDEAQELGFYDKIITGEETQIPEDVMKLNTEQRFKKYAAMTFKLPTTQNPTQNKNKMSKPNSYPNLEATLGLKHPLATTENGSYLNEDQKQTLENQLSAQATSLKNAQDAKNKAVADLDEAKKNHSAALQAEKDKTTAAEKKIRDAATLAGVENLAEDASAEDIAKALTAQIEVLNGKPGAAHTNGVADEEESEFSYLNLESSIYKDLK